MRLRARGFTMIELVAVIVVLGVLAALALPRFLDFRDDAKLAAMKGVYAAAADAAHLNFAAVRVGKAGYAPISSGAGLLGAMDAATRQSWFAPGGPYMWEPASEYGIEVVTPESSAGPATLALVDSNTDRVYP